MLWKLPLITRALDQVRLSQRGQFRRIKAIRLWVCDFPLHKHDGNHKSILFETNLPGCKRTSVITVPD